MGRVCLCEQHNNNRCATREHQFIKTLVATTAYVLAERDRVEVGTENWAQLNCNSKS